MEETHHLDADNVVDPHTAGTIAQAPNTHMNTVEDHDSNETEEQLEANDGASVAWSTLFAQKTIRKFFPNSNIFQFYEVYYTGNQEPILDLCRMEGLVVLRKRVDSRKDFEIRELDSSIDSSYSTEELHKQIMDHGDAIISVGGQFCAACRPSEVMLMIENNPRPVPIVFLRFNKAVFPLCSQQIEPRVAPPSAPRIKHFEQDDGSNQEVQHHSHDIQDQQQPHDDQNQTTENHVPMHDDEDTAEPAMHDQQYSDTTVGDVGGHAQSESLQGQSAQNSETLQSVAHSAATADDIDLQSNQDGNIHTVAAQPSSSTSDVNGENNQQQDLMENAYTEIKDPQQNHEPHGNGEEMEEEQATKKIRI